MPNDQTKLGMSQDVPEQLGTQPHRTSIAVWGVPAPVVVDSLFAVQVGVKCSSTCRLTGQFVEVREEAGSKISNGRLGDAPLPGTSGLYVADVTLSAPATEGVCRWSVAFSGDELPSPHESAVATFSCRTVKPPEHGVTIKVTGRDAGTPLSGIEVFMGVYRASTDERGMANLELPKGTYELNLRKRGYEAPPMIVEMDGDVTVPIEISPAPERNPDEDQEWM